MTAVGSYVSGSKVEPGLMTVGVVPELDPIFPGSKIALMHESRVGIGHHGSNPVGGV